MLLLPLKELIFLTRLSNSPSLTTFSILSTLQTLTNSNS